MTNFVSGGNNDAPSVEQPNELSWLDHLAVADHLENNYIGVIFLPDGITIPTGLVRVKYSVRLDDAEQHDVHLAISYLKSFGLWSVIYGFQSILKGVFYYFIYMLIGIIHSLI